MAAFPKAPNPFEEMTYWESKQYRPKRKVKKGLKTDTLPVPPPPPVQEDVWDPEEPVAKTSYDDDRPCEPEAGTKYDDILARDAEPSTACDTPAANGEGEAIGECEAIAETIPDTTYWGFIAPPEPSSAEETSTKDQTWPEEKSPATEEDPTKAYEELAEEAKPADGMLYRYICGEIAVYSLTIHT